MSILYFVPSSIKYFCPIVNSIVSSFLFMTEVFVSVFQSVLHSKSSAMSLIGRRIRPFLLKVYIRQSLLFLRSFLPLRFHFSAPRLLFLWICPLLVSHHQKHHFPKYYWFIQLMFHRLNLYFSLSSLVIVPPIPLIRLFIFCISVTALGGNILIFSALSVSFRCVWIRPFAILLAKLISCLALLRPCVLNI